MTDIDDDKKMHLELRIHNNVAIILDFGEDFPEIAVNKEQALDLAKKLIYLSNHLIKMDSQNGTKPASLFSRISKTIKRAWS